MRLRLTSEQLAQGLLPPKQLANRLNTSIFEEPLEEFLREIKSSPEPEVKTQVIDPGKNNSVQKSWHKTVLDFFTSIISKINEMTMKKGNAA